MVDLNTFLDDCKKNNYTHVFIYKDKDDDVSELKGFRNWHEATNYAEMKMQSLDYGSIKNFGTPEYRELSLDSIFDNPFIYFYKKDDYKALLVYVSTKCLTSYLQNFIKYDFEF